ncbi:elongation factor P 5-aminopentanone reductase [Salirhabdus sp. Marseille-P4669]|uniref:elongation factor P 5-aminopentanone reductase n=1 Tax=Salirhabdus sp. Marseille-P4669 TaxID=2042310 RepID=UPI00190EAC23|nr:SDR family oxidoreductase [Salirhabdus sp. Marseille-P4669]
MERKICLITGASGDIGEAITKAVLHDGWQVILHCNQNIAKVREMTKHFPEESVLSIIQSDLSSEAGIQLLLDSLAFSVDAFVHASGTALYGLFQETSDQQMHDMFYLHVYAPWKISKEILPNMVRKQQGHIVVISSIWGEVGASNEVIYSSVKGAQNSFVKALSKEVAFSNINVNAVSPGFINTKMNGHLSGSERDELLDSIPAGRAGAPEDVAELVSFLISSKASYINGQVVSVNGGW